MIRDAFEAISRADTAEVELAALRAAVHHFIDRPGCNPTQRQLALKRLRWASGYDDYQDDSQGESSHNQDGR